MSVENQSVNFAKEFVTNSRLVILGLFLLLAVSIGMNAYQFYRVTELTLDNKAITETLKDTQKTLLNQEDESAKKVSARIIQNVYGVPHKLALQIAEYEVKYSRKYNIPLHIGLAITAKESTFNPKAVSYNGSSFGLKQINCSAWCKTFGVSKQELFDMERNIEFGYRVMAENLKRTGSMDRALAAYLGSTDPSANQAYASAILSKARLFDIT